MAASCRAPWPGERSRGSTRPEALGLPGVVQVLTHENAPRLPPLDFTDIDPVASPGSGFVPLQGNEITFSLQPVALALAESFELARHAASLVRIEYERGTHVTDFDAARAHAYVAPRSRPVIPPPPKPRGVCRARAPHCRRAARMPSIGRRWNITIRWSCSRRR